MIDYGMMSDIPEKDRYGLIGLVIGLKLKDFSLATENLLKVSVLFPKAYFVVKLTCCIAWVSRRYYSS